MKVLVLAVFKVPVNTANQLVSQSPEYNVFDCVTQAVPPYRLFSLQIVDLSVALDLKVDRVHVSMGCKLIIAVESVGLVSSLAQEAGRGWLMLDLLKVPFRAVFSASLVSFSYNRVQWLIPVVT